MGNYAVVLAAGKGTRMKSIDPNKSKVSFEILKKPIVKYVIEALKPLNLESIITIVGHGGEATKQIVENDSLIVWQKEQKGTGHAVMQTRDILANKDGNTIVCCGDTPLVNDKIFKDLLERHEQEGNDLTVVAAVLDNPFGYGRIVRNEKGDELERIVEQTDCDEKIGAIKEVNAGIYLFRNKKLFEHLEKLDTRNAKGELYITDLVKVFKSQNLKVGAYTLENPNDMMGVNTRWQLYEASEELKMRKNKQLMLNGVTIIDAKSTYIGYDVVIEEDTTIYPNTHIYGKTLIQSNVTIGPDSYIENCTIEKDAIVEKSIVRNKTIKQGTKIGPFEEIK